jgi:hypothetical protein
VAVFGELELTAALGAEAPGALIEEIEYQTQPVKGAKGPQEVFYQEEKKYG